MAYTLFIRHTIIITAFVSVCGWAQNEKAKDTTVEKSAKKNDIEETGSRTESLDNAKTIQSNDSGYTGGFRARDMISDTAATDETADKEISDTTQQDSAFYPQGNPFLGVEASNKETAPSDTSSVSILLIDISRGVTISGLIAQPRYLDTAVKPGFVCDIGLRFVIRRWLLFGVIVRYFETNYGIENSYSGIDHEIRTNTGESMRFVSLPIEITAIFDFNRVLPYISICMEPALFTSGYYYSNEHATATFPDSSTLVSKRSYDRDISDDRDRYQGFSGIGAGVEIPYGFASIYIQGFFQMGLRDIGTDNTRPVRTESRLFYFPVSIGLRFSL